MRPRHHLERVGVDLNHVDSLLAPGRERTEKLMDRAMTAMVRPTETDILEWAENTLEIPSGTGYSSGYFRALPFQKGIIKSWQEPGVERIYFQKVPRVGSSFISAIGILYNSCHEAQDSVYYERSKEDVQAFHDTNIEPILKESKALRHLVLPDHMTKWHDYLLGNGAFIRHRSASKDGAFKAIKSPKVFTDEIDGKEWQPKKKGDGDKFDRAAKRAQQFGNGLIYGGSSPGRKKTSIVCAGYDLSDQRVFKVACERCGTPQEFLPNMMTGDHAPGLNCRLDEAGNYAMWTDPKSGLVTPDIWYTCIKCNRQIREIEKKAMMAGGDWDAKVPGGARKGWVGFYINSMYSTDPKSRWYHVMDAFRATLVDPTKLQTFTNEWLALPYDDENIRPMEVNWLKKARSICYPAPCPPPVKLASAGGDNQRGAKATSKRAKAGNEARSEVSVVGWAAGEEAYVLAHHVIPHAPFTPESNAAKIEIMRTPIYRPDGTYIMPGGMADDIGDGETMDRALQFVTSREAREVGIVGIKGASEERGQRSPTVRSGIAKDKALQFEVIGTQSAKDVWMRRFLLEGFGAERVHFPDSFGIPYFEGVLGLTMIDEGDGKFWWKDRKPNEPIDCLVYAYARMLMFKRNTRMDGSFFIDNLLAYPETPEDQKRYFGGVIEPLIAYRGPDRSHQSPSVVAERAMAGTTTEELRIVRFVDKPAPPAPPPQEPSRQQQSPLPQPPGAPRVQRTPVSPRTEAPPSPQDDLPQYGRIGRAPRMGWR